MVVHQELVANLLYISFKPLLVLVDFRDQTGGGGPPGVGSHLGDSSDSEMCGAPGSAEPKQEPPDSPPFNGGKLGDLEGSDPGQRTSDTGANTLGGGGGGGHGGGGGGQHTTPVNMTQTHGLFTELQKPPPPLGGVVSSVGGGMIPGMTVVSHHTGHHIPVSNNNNEVSPTHQYSSQYSFELS